jgi:hypothetical protein
MNPITFLLRKLFLVKEIVSKDGELHFRRYRLFSTSRGSIYLHHILKSDEDAHLHDHPWHFTSFILKGSYQEQCTLHPTHRYTYTSVYSAKPAEIGHKPRRHILHHAQDAHSLTLLTPAVWTLVFTWGRPRLWGYQTSQGWIDFETYRQLKRTGQLPE